MRRMQKVKLGDLISILTDYHANGSYKTLKRNVELLDDPNYAVMIRTTNFEQNNFDDNKYISEHAYGFLRKSKVYPNDILMNKIANAGSVYLMPDLKRPVSLGMNLFLIRLNPELADPKYIYYYLKVNEKYIKLFANGAATTTITKEMVRRLSISLPDIITQQNIASISSNYNDLIDANRRRIQLLEGSARLLFREWFVYFRFPGYEKMKMVDGVPYGWKKEKIKKVLTLEYGKSLVADKRENGDIPVYGSSGVIGFHNKALVKGPGIIVGRAGNAGAVHWVNDDFFPVDSTFYVKTKMNNLLLYFYYYLSICHLERFISGSAVPGLNRNIVYSSNILLSETNIIEKFNELVDQINKQCLYLRNQNQRLVEARDLLLPRLMSGAISV